MLKTQKLACWLCPLSKGQSEPMSGPYQLSKSQRSHIEYHEIIYCLRNKIFNIKRILSYQIQNALQNTLFKVLIYLIEFVVLFFFFSKIQLLDWNLQFKSLIFFISFYIKKYILMIVLMHIIHLICINMCIFMLPCCYVHFLGFVVSLYPYCIVSMSRVHVHTS